MNISRSELLQYLKSILAIPGVTSVAEDSTLYRSSWDHNDVRIECEYKVYCMEHGDTITQVAAVLNDMEVKWKLVAEGEEMFYISFESAPVIVEEVFNETNT